MNSNDLLLACEFLGCMLKLIGKRKINFKVLALPNFKIGKIEVFLVGMVLEEELKNLLQEKSFCENA